MKKKLQVTLHLPAKLKMELVDALEHRLGINAQQWGRRLARSTVAGELDSLLVQDDGDAVLQFEMAPERETFAEVLDQVIRRWGQRGPIYDAAVDSAERRRQYINQLMDGVAKLDPPPPPPQRFDFEDD